MKTSELIKKAEELLAKCSDGPWIHGGVKYKHWRLVGKREDGGANFKHPNGCKNYGIAILDGESTNKIYTPRIVCELLDSDMQLHKTFREDADFIIFSRNHMQELIDRLKRHEDVLKLLKTGNCWCGIGIGHPSYTSHSSGCILARKALGDE